MAAQRQLNPKFMLQYVKPLNQGGRNEKYKIIAGSGVGGVEKIQQGRVPY
jgi:hypothetical protein